MRLRSAAHLNRSMELDIVIPTLTRPSEIKIKKTTPTGKFIQPKDI